MTNPFDSIELNPKEVKQVYDNKTDKNPFDEVEYEESWGKNLLRTLYQIPSGIAQLATYPLDLLQMAGIGEALDEEDLDRLEMISKRENIPFDREKYMKSLQEATESFPTQGNIERLIENKTGAPLTPKTGLQKGIKLGAMAGKMAPGTLLQKGSAAVAAPLASKGLQEAGVPEPIADIAGLGGSQVASKLTPKIDIGKAKKSSGLTKRRFESIEKPIEVSRSRYNRINEAVESDFKKIADKLINESPIKKTYSALKEDKSFKSKVGDLFKDVESLAEQIPDKFPSQSLKRDLLKKSQDKKGISITPSEYDKAYQKFVHTFVKETPIKEITTKDFISQYRANNRGLSEVYEPGKSNAYNRAKKDALLDYNRTIAETIEKKFPNTELNDLFKFSNKRWSEIKDAESISKFMDDLFDGKIQYKKGEQFFSKDKVADSFKRSLGEENFPKFEQLMKDLMDSKQAHSLLKVAESKGYKSLAETGLAYLLHPVAAKAKFGLDAAKMAYKSLLDKPQLAFTWDEGIKAMKKGDFAKAQENFSSLDKELK